MQEYKTNLFSNSTFDSLKKYRAYHIYSVWDYSRRENLENYGIDNRGIYVDIEDNILQIHLESALNNYVLSFKKEFGNIKNTDREIKKPSI